MSKNHPRLTRVAPLTALCISISDLAVASSLPPGCLSTSEHQDRFRSAEIIFVATLTYAFAMLLIVQNAPRYAHSESFARNKQTGMGISRTDPVRCGHRMDTCEWWSVLSPHSDVERS